MMTTTLVDGVVVVTMMMVMVMLTLSSLSSSVSVVTAFPMLAAHIPNGNNVACPPGVAGCENNAPNCAGVGHNSCIGGSLPLNPFGEALKSTGYQWTKELCMQDSDGDGMTNGMELGDPCCTWTPEGGSETIFQGASHPGFATSILEDAAATARSVCDTAVVSPPPALQQLSAESSATTDPGQQQPEEESQRRTREQELGIFRDDEIGTAITFRPKPWEVPAQETSYTCHMFEYPSDDSYHVVAFEPIIDQFRTLHHIAVFACEDDAPLALGESEDCTGMPTRGCLEYHGGWTPGGWGEGPNGLWKMPPDAGFRVGKGALRKVVLQYHHSNLNRQAGLMDSSGMKMYLSRGGRTQDVGDLWAGSIVVATIPPRSPTWNVAQTCRWPSNITVFATRGHMHETGTAVYSRLLDRRGNEIDMLGVTYPFDYQYQPIVNLDRDVIVQPGDQIQTHCQFNTAHKNTWTIGGIATNQEMCINHLLFYPKPRNWQAEPFCIGRIWQGPRLEREFGGNQDA